jgi:hypothetical protein
MQTNVKRVLVTEDGEVLDSTELLTASEYNRARESMPGAYALLGELRKVAEQ